MFRDYNKYLSTSVKVYLFVLLIIFILKLVGLDYFGIDTNNISLMKLSDFLSNNHFGDVYYFLTIYIQFYLYICIVCKKQKLYIPALIGSCLNFSYQIIIPNFLGIGWIYQILSISIMLIFPMFIIKKITIKRQIKYIILISVYQLICLSVRNVGVNNNYNNFLIDSILNIDQLLLLAITYNINFMKGDVKLCGETLEVGYSLLKNFLKVNMQ